METLESVQTAESVRELGVAFELLQSLRVQ